MVSIIVAVYNSVAYINRCIKSVIAQTEKNWELILIDDCSLDNSYLLCKKWIKKDKRIRLFKTIKNSGPSKARNIGLENAKGEWITFIDSDDWIDEDYIEKNLKSARKNNSDIVMCNMINHYKHNSVSEKTFNKEVFIEKKDFIILYRIILELETETGSSGIELTGVCCKLIKSNIAKANKFDEKLDLGEDTIFVCACLNCANSFFYNTETSYHRLVRSDSLSYKRTYNYVFRRMKYVNYAIRFLVENDVLNGETKKILNQMVYVNYKDVINYYRNLHWIKGTLYASKYIDAFLHNVKWNLDFNMAFDSDPRNIELLRNGKIITYKRRIINKNIIELVDNKIHELKERIR